MDTVAEQAPLRLIIPWISLAVAQKSLFRYVVLSSSPRAIFMSVLCGDEFPRRPANMLLDNLILCFVMRRRPHK